MEKIEMIRVPGNTIISQITKEPVVLKDYFIGKYPVTNEQWRRVMGFPRYLNEDVMLEYDEAKANHPIQYVSHEDALIFIARLNHITGKDYRLPTAEEWDLASMGGDPDCRFLYGITNDLTEVAWTKQNSPHNDTSPVGLLKPNNLGIYDMFGNVREHLNTECKHPSFTNGFLWYVTGMCFSTLSYQAERLPLHVYLDMKLRSVGFRLAHD